MNKIINNILKYKYTYLIIFLTLLIMFGIFSIDRYALDTYFYESNGMRYNAINPYFYNGRIFMTIFLYILSILNVSFSLGKLLSWLLAFISLYISTILCFNILSKYKKSNIINVLLSICLVANPFIIEYFMFPEYTGIMCLGILFTFISIFTIDYYFQKSNKIALAFAILAAMCSVMCYQGGISLLFIIPLLFIFKDSKTLKEFLKKLLIVCLVFGIAALTTAILSKILGAERLGNNFNFIKSIKEALKGSGILLTTTYQTLPKYLLIIIAIICSVGTLVTIEKKPKTILFYVLCILSLLIVPVIPHFFAAYIWLVPRSCLGYGLLAAISILFYLIYNKNNKYVNGIYILSMLTIIFFQTISGVNFAKGAMKNDLLNDLESKEVIKEINKYEKENKITIENVVAYYDQNPTYVSQGVKSAGDMNPRAFGYSWSYRAALATRIKRTLKDGKLNSKIEKICKDQDWLEYEKEQLHFENDTLYVCIY